jgi:hypothetical protein
VLIDDVLVNGKKLVANFDTGSSGGFDLTPAAVSYLGPGFARKVPLAREPNPALGICTNSA